MRTVIINEHDFYRYSLYILRTKKNKLIYGVIRSSNLPALVYNPKILKNKYNRQIIKKIIEEFPVKLIFEEICNFKMAIAKFYFLSKKHSREEINEIIRTYVWPDEFFKSKIYNTINVHDCVNTKEFIKFLESLSVCQD